MREISKLEKRIIAQICKEKTHISKLFTDHIPDLILDLDRDNEKVSLIIKVPINSKSIIETAMEQTEMIMYIINFLLYLENEGYVMSGKFAHGRTIQGKFVTNDNIEKYNQNPDSYTKWEFTDPSIGFYIFEYCDLTIFASYLLKIFKKNKYKSKTDKRHCQTLFVSYFAILVSLLLGIWSIFQSKIYDNPTKEQIERLIQSVQEIKSPQNLPTSQQIDTLINNINKK